MRPWKRIALLVSVSACFALAACATAPNVQAIRACVPRDVPDNAVDGWMPTDHLSPEDVLYLKHLNPENAERDAARNLRSGDYRMIAPLYGFETIVGVGMDLENAKRVYGLRTFPQISDTGVLGLTQVEQISAIYYASRYNLAIEYGCALLEMRIRENLREVEDIASPNQHQTLP